MNASQICLSQGASIQAHLSIARRAIETCENDLRRAAEHVAEAQALGASQREIAASIGKSAAWVNGLLRWRRLGYRETPFGPQSKASRELARVQSPKLIQAATVEAHGTDSDESRANSKAGLRADACVEESNGYIILPAEGNTGTRKLSGYERARLIQALGFLATEPPRSRAAFALSLEKHRAMLGLTWDELLIPAEEDKAFVVVDAENAVLDLDAGGHSSEMPDIPEFLRGERPKPTLGSAINEWHRCRGFILALELADRQRLIAERVAPFVTANQAQSVEPKQARPDVGASTEREEPAQ